jgi:hypothetical protein
MSVVRRAKFAIMDTKLPYANSTAGQAAEPRPGSQARALPLSRATAAAAAAASGSTLQLLRC